METTAIDRYGRIVIPKSVRDILGLDPTSELTVTVEGDQILLCPIADPDHLALRDGVLIFEGQVLDDIPSTLDTLQLRREKICVGGAA